MADARTVLGGVAGLLVVGALGTYLGVLAARPPKPDLPYPSGQTLEQVRGNCDSGNELVGCDSGKGPRSFLDVSATGDVRAASDALFGAMTADGWKRDDAGLVAADHAAGGASEDIQPVFCRGDDGCVGLFRYDTDGYVLAWWSAPAP